MKASEVAIYTLQDSPGKISSDRWHKLGVGMNGGVGGGSLSSIAIELPFCTSRMLRSIADIARSQGESVHAIKTKLACLEVFALGGKTQLEDDTESGYYAVRTTLACL